MASDHTAIGSVLAEILPREESSGDWTRVMRDSRPRRKKRALALAFAGLATAVVVPLAALAVTQGWWFSNAGAPQPVSGIVVVAQGSWSGVPWTLSAYRSDTDGICYALTPRGQANARGLGAAMACDRIGGVAPRFRLPQPERTMGYLLSGGRQISPYVTGPVVASAASVDVILGKGRHIRVATIPAPRRLHAHIGFYVARLSVGDTVRSVVARSARGRIVAFLPVVPNAAVPVAQLGRFSNHGKRLVLPPRLVHALRLAHRSALIRLIATRDGRNYYRLGGAAQVCFGVGRAVPLASIPPTRRGIGRLAGIILCAPRTPTSFPSRAHPVWDLSVYGADRKHPHVRLLQLEGFASDAVKVIVLLNARNQPVGRVRVRGNVYSLRTVPPGVVAIAPSDLGGRPLAICGPGARALTSGSYLQAHC